MTLTHFAAVLLGIVLALVAILFLTSCATPKLCVTLVEKDGIIVRVCAMGEIKSVDIEPKSK